MIPYGKQSISAEDIAAVVEVLESDFLTQGPKVPLFEESVAHYCGADFGIAVNSATSALHIACLALGLGQGDRLWVSPNTFVASANCGLYCGAQVDFIDIDSATYNISIEELEKKLLDAQSNNTLPKIIIPVHFAGQSCDMKRIYELSLQYGFRIIEDASHAIGGKYAGTKIGGCQYSDITVFSFHPVKIITTAEGGIALTNQSELAEKMQLFRSHGVTRNPDLMNGPTHGDWYYQQVALGYNYRMTEIQAALGLSQLQRLDEFILLRHQIKNRYDELLKEMPVILPYQSSENFSALHLYPIQIKLEEITKTRKQIFNYLRENGIGVNVHYIPVHTQPYYKGLGFNGGDFPHVESYYSRALSIPLYQGMTDEQQNEVIRVFREAIK